MTGVQQRGAGTPALAAGANSQDRQVLVEYTGRMVGFECLVEDGEPAGPRRGRVGQSLPVARQRADSTGSGGQS